MNEKFEKILGAGLFLLGIVLLASSQTRITGSVISETAGGVGSVLSLVMIIGGLFLFEAGLEKKVGGNEEIKKEIAKIYFGRTKISDYKELSRYAEELGCDVEKIGIKDHDYDLVSKNKKKITLIPRDDREITKEVYRGIARDLLERG